MSNHTPGPWKFETVQTSVGICHKIGPFPWQNGKENAACLYVDYAGGGPIEAELLANARLIAAAPELLEALERAEESLCLAESMLDMHQDDSPNFEPAILKARAAIVKARGEA